MSWWWIVGGLAIANILIWLLFWSMLRVAGKADERSGLK